MSRWYQGNGNNSDVVMFSQVRLARNLADAPFPVRMSTELKKSITKRLYATIKSSYLANEFDLVSLQDVSRAKAMYYAEKGLISKAFAESKEPVAFLLSKNENVSIMLCEEDHIRINSFATGNDIYSAYEKADKVDDIFIDGQKIAFSEKLGFLTSSPINLGTGLRASFALHLPGLTKKDAMYSLSSMVGKLGLSLREMYPSAAGDMYILSNQVSLGISEKSALDNLSAICDQIIKQERAARDMIKDDPEFEDRIYRTLGMLKMARKLEQKEFFDYMSLVRLGISLGYFDYSYETVGDMIYSLQDATLVDSAKADLNSSTCAKLRAQLVREKLD